MSRFGKVGAFGQTVRPHIRGGLDPSHEQSRHGNMPRLEDYKTDEETYFVPSFSIRRHLHNSEELLWDTNQHLIKRRLGRNFTATPADDITLKTIEQHRFIKNMREAGIHPDPDEIRDLAYSVRDDLTNMLASARSPLWIPLGELGRFGYQNNALAYETDGWRGDRANYAMNDDEGYMDTMAVILAERRLSVGAIALAYEDEGLSIENLAPSPHITIARAKESIPDYRLRGLRGELSDLAIEGAYFGDPVISIKMYRDEPAEPIYIKHSWDSLALRDVSA